LFKTDNRFDITALECALKKLFAIYDFYLGNHTMQELLHEIHNVTIPDRDLGALKTLVYEKLGQA